MSLDHLVRPDQHRLRNRQAQSLGGLEVDYQFELRRLLDGEVGGLGALEDLVDVGCDPAVRSRKLGPYAMRPPASTNSRASYIAGSRCWAAKATICCRWSRERFHGRQEGRRGVPGPGWQKRGRGRAGSRTHSTCSVTPKSRAAASVSFTGRPCRVAHIPEQGRRAARRGSISRRSCSPFPAQLRGYKGEPGDIGTRVGEACHEAGAHGVTAAGEHDGDRAGRLFRREDGGVRRCDEHIHPEPDKLRREGREPCDVAVCPAVFDDEVLALHVAEVAQPLPECVGGGRHRTPLAHRNPIRGTFPVCCASAASGAAKTVRASARTNIAVAQSNFDIRIRNCLTGSPHPPARGSTAGSSAPGPWRS